MSSRHTLVWPDHALGMTEVGNWLLVWINVAPTPMTDASDESQIAGKD